MRSLRFKDSEKGLYQYHLGMVNLKLGEGEEARQALQQALKLTPKFPGADETRKLLAEL